MKISVEDVIKVFESIKQLQSDLDSKNNIIDELVEALESLYSEQNGVPLLRHQDSWQRAMDLTLTILEKVRVKE